MRESCCWFHCMKKCRETGRLITGCTVNGWDKVMSLFLDKLIVQCYIIWNIIYAYIMLCIIIRKTSQSVHIDIPESFCRPVSHWFQEGLLALAGLQKWHSEPQTLSAKQAAYFEVSGRRKRPENQNVNLLKYYPPFVEWFSGLMKLICIRWWEILYLIDRGFYFTWMWQILYLLHWNLITWWHERLKSPHFYSKNILCTF